MRYRFFSHSFRRRRPTGGPVRSLGCLVILASLAGFACNRTVYAAPDLPVARVDLPASPEGSLASVVLAGGCFWCTEAVFEQLNGVGEVVSGYAGGAADEADYGRVSSGRTAHAEVIRVTYDPAVISYGTLLRVFFAAAHDPTQTDGQGNDIGLQYRSAIFYASEPEQRVAEAYIAQLDASGVLGRPIATTLEPLAGFYRAEDYHQDYVRRNPAQPYVVAVALPKVAKVRKGFAELLKPRVRD